MRTFVLKIIGFVTLIAFVGGISIDGQLTVIKNDCYERMAIGEKLSPKQTYKSFEHNTVSKCEMECTHEKERCRTYSFGIGPKGNGTCLLSRNPVKETADLKPIGTISDTDYDLYIKKLDCQVILEPHQQQTSPPSQAKPHNFEGTANADQHQQNEYGVQEHHHGQSDQFGHYGNLPAQSNYHSSVSNPNQESNQGYHYDKPHNSHRGPQSNNQHQQDGLHHVQTFVSIASGPQNVLHPVHDILVSGDSFEQQKPPILQSNGNGYDQQHNGNMPPFRPPALNHPYDDHRPQHPPQRPFNVDYGSHDRPNPNYGDSGPSVPPNTHLENGYGYGYGYGGHDTQYINDNKPNVPYPNDFSKPYRPNLPIARPNDNRPDPDYGPRPPKLPDFGYGGGETQMTIDRRKYESFNQFNSFESEIQNEHPKHYDPGYNYYDHYQKPNPNYPNRYGSVIPHPNDYDHPGSHYDYLFVRPNSDFEYDRPNRPMGTRPEYDGHRAYDQPERPSLNHEQGYDEPKPQRPDGSLRPNPDYGDASQRPDQQPYPTKRPGHTSSSSSRPPSTELTNHYGGMDYNRKQYGKPGESYNMKGDNGDRKIISESVGYHGEKITSIITELNNACFRRTVAGKRVVRGLVRKLLICDTVEQCQQECGDERRFTCEGFNYRLDPTGRGKGECELLDLPLSRIDIARELVSDPDYDFYTRDRNAAQVNCRQPPSNSYVPGGSHGGGGYRYGYEDWHEGGNRRGDEPYDKRPTDIGRPLRRPGARWEVDYGDHRPPRPLPIDRRPLPEDDRRHDYGNRRGDYSFHHSHESHSSHSYHYNEHNVDRYNYHQHEGHHRPIHDSFGLDDRFVPPKPYPVIIPLDDKYPKDPLPSRYPPDRSRYPPDRLPERDYWGLNREKWGSYSGRYGDRYRNENDRLKYYIPPRPQTQPDIPEDWGLYGGSYGTGTGTLEYQGYGNRHTYNYWGFNKFQGEKRPTTVYDSDLLPPRRPASYQPIEKPRPAGSYLPLPPPSHGGSYLPHTSGGYEIDNSILPAEPRRPPTFDFIRDECSLRSATGFRLHKGVVKKFFSVPNIYECELLCVREKDFPCASYAFRYTLFAENCYLSNRDYKELDYYTDLEPDRDVDIYTMNNRQRCQEPGAFLGREDSDCFWRVRSGQRLDHTVVRDSLTVKSIVDCQLECLKSRRFTCRAYSFRYGSPIIGSAIDNCQLTDWPFYELDPKTHFIPEREFEVYERGSYGHGCEPDHFGIRGKNPVKDGGVKVDQLCYIGFGTAAKLLPQATIKSIFVPTELDCKGECSKAREGTVFRCMSFSFVTGGPKVGHNCFLSDIMQRDLLPNVDYVHDPDSWLFTWDNYNPECIDLAYKPLHSGHSSSKGIGYIEKYGPDYVNALDVWRIYSVSGWPCKRGSLCKENREAGFWYCELEGGEKNAWDYCCSPDHHCGFSNGYSYSWCYVGPSRTQWRKCNDQYYPYIHNVLERFDNSKRPWHTSGYFPPAPQNTGYRPDRPNAPARPDPPKPSLDEYEQEFDHEFLSPPKPGGFGQPRRWPVAYLHKEMPPSITNADSRPTRTEKSENTKLAAIKDLINVIQNTEIQNVQYHISNDSNKPDDVLYVKIPLPNLDDESEITTKEPERNQSQLNELRSKTKVNFEVVDTAHEQRARTQKSLPIQREVTKVSDKEYASRIGTKFTLRNVNEDRSKFPVVRRGFVTRTNVTSDRKYRSF